MIAGSATPFDPVIVRGLRHPVDERARRHGNGSLGNEILAARDVPRARHNDAKPVSLVPMRRAHVSGMPPDEHEILSWRVDVAEHIGGFRHARGQLESGFQEISSGRVTMVIVGSTPAALPRFTPSAMAAIATRGAATRTRRRVSIRSWPMFPRLPLWCSAWHERGERAIFCGCI